MQRTTSAPSNVRRTATRPNCHTDITIPYDELGEVSVVTMTEEVIPIIEEGRFVLAGCEELNAPFDQESMD